MKSQPKESKETPLMKQYNAIKAKYPDALLLFRVGDFYETFGEDAVKTAGILGIILTKRGAGSESEIELAGFPHHSINTYLPKLVKAGQRVAICDQLEDPKLTKDIVKRGVTELVTPGVALNDEVLLSKSNNFLCSVYFDKKHIGISFLMFLVIVIFNSVNDASVVKMIFKIASYTYGPLLGLYAFGLFVKSKTVNDKLVPFICVISPAICYFISANSAYLFGNYVIDNELIILNGLITLLGLFIISKPAIQNTRF